QGAGSRAGEPSDDLGQAALVDVVELAELVGVDVEHGHELALSREHRHDDLRPRATVARDVPGELLDVGYDHGAAFGDGRAAHAFPERDLEATEGALVRT